MILWLLSLSLFTHLASAARSINKLVVYDVASDGSSVNLMAKAWKQHCPCKYLKVSLELYTNTSVDIPYKDCFTTVKYIIPESRPQRVERERAIFERVMSESAGQHVLFLSVNTLPIVNHWLDRANELVVEPNAHFWIKTSLGLAGEYSLGSKDAFYHHLLPSGLYNMSPEFDQNYAKIKLFVHQNYPQCPFSHTFHHYLYDSRVMGEARFMFSKFVVDDFIHVARGEVCSGRSTPCSRLSNKGAWIVSPWKQTRAGIYRMNVALYTLLCILCVSAIPVELEEASLQPGAYPRNPQYPSSASNQRHSHDIPFGQEEGASSHVVVPFHYHAKQLERLEKQADMWARYSPCDPGERSLNVTLVWYLFADPDPHQLARLHNVYAVKYARFSHCFAGFEIRSAGLEQLRTTQTCRQDGCLRNCWRTALVCVRQTSFSILSPTCSP